MQYFQKIPQVITTTEQVFHLKDMLKMILHCHVEHIRRNLDMLIVWRKVMCHRSRVCWDVFLLGFLTIQVYGAIKFLKTSQAIKDIQFLLTNILDGFADDGECFPPCSKMTFNSRLTRFDPRDDRIGLFIQFEKKIKTVGVTFIIDEITLLTRIGGIIGVGKEILWAIIFFFGFLKIFLITIKKLFFQ